MKRLIILISFGIFLITGCMNSQNVTNTPSSDMLLPQHSPSPSLEFMTSASSLTEEMPATSTLLPPTNTPTAFPTATMEKLIEARCIEINASFRQEMKLDGILVLTSPQDVDNSIVLIDLQIGNKYTVPKQENELLGQIAISPDRKLLAYRKAIVGSADKRLIEDWLIVEDANGQQTAIIPYKTKDLAFPENGQWEAFYWLDNQRLVIRQYAESGIDTSLVLNPFTGQQQELIAWGNYDYLDITAETGLLWETITIFNPVLTRVVYPGLTDNFEQSIVLWDLERSQLLANIPAMIFASRERPKWSLDGTQFAFAISDNSELPPPWRQEIFAINREGQVTRLTFLTEVFKDVSIGNFNWSPDGRFIAFWFTDRSSDPLIEELAVLDTLTLDVVNYCIHGDGSSAPIWSPTGDKLAVISPIINQDDSNVILVDYINGYAVPIAENMVLEGWLESPP